MKELQSEIKPAKRQAPRIKMRGKEMIIAQKDIMRALGTNSADFTDGVLQQLANAVSPVLTIKNDEQKKEVFLRIC